MASENVEEFRLVRVNKGSESSKSKESEEATEGQKQLFASEKATDSASDAEGSSNEADPSEVQEPPEVPPVFSPLFQSSPKANAKRFIYDYDEAALEPQLAEIWGFAPPSSFRKFGRF